MRKMDHDNDDADSLVLNTEEPDEQMDGLAVSSVSKSVSYYERIENDSDLHLQKEDLVWDRYKKDGFFGLFCLFFTLKLQEDIVQWTNERIQGN